MNDDELFPGLTSEPIPEPETNNNTTSEFTPTEENIQKPKPGFWSDIVPAAFRNTITYKLGEGFSKNLVKSHTALVYDPIMEVMLPTPIQEEKEENFVLEEAIKDIPEEKRKYYWWCENSKDIQTETDWLADEEADNEILSQYPIQSLVAGIGTGLLDPVTWVILPFKAFSVAETGVAFAVQAAKNVGVEAMKFASLDVLASTASKEKYTVNDAVFEVISSGILGASMSLAGSSISAVLKSKYVKSLAENIKNSFPDRLFEVSKDSIKEIGEGISEQYTLSKMPNIIQKVFGKTNPILAGLTSDSETLRKFTNAIYSHSFKLNKPIDDNVISFQEGRNFLKALLNNYMQENINCAKQSGLKLSEFNRAVGIALRDDLVSTNEHINHAKNLFLEIYNKYVDTALSYNKLDFDPRVKGTRFKNILRAEDSTVPENKRAAGYFPRVYNKRKVLDNALTFKEMLKESILINMEEKQNIKKATEIADYMFDNITKNNLLKYTEPFKINRGIRLDREIVVMIEDKLLEPYMVLDPMQIMQAVDRQLGPEIELARITKELNLKTELNTNKTELEIWLETLNNEKKIKTEGKEGKELFDIQKKYDEYAQLITDGFELAKGTFGEPKTHYDLNVARASNLLKIWNFTRQLGGVTISSLVDYMNIVSKFGIFKPFKGILHSFSSDLAFKANKKDLIRFGAANEEAILSVYNRFLDTNDLSQYEGNNIISNGINRIANLFNKASLLPMFNDFNKRIVSTLHAGDILKAIENKNIEFLSEHRISQKAAKLIESQFKKFGKWDKYENPILNLSQWTSEEAVKTISASINHMANSTIIVPGIGDTPRWFKSTWGKLLVQYQSYQFGLMNNILLPWTNGQNINNIIPALLTGISLGYVSEYLRAFLSGDPYTNYDDPSLIMGAIDKSGCLAYLFDPGENIFKAFQYLSGKEILGRHNYESGFSEILSKMSPQIGLLDDIFHSINHLPRMIRAVNKDDDYNLSERDMRKLKGLIPFNNLWLFNGFLNSKIRKYAEDNDRKLLKTREEKYWENKE